MPTIKGDPSRTVNALHWSGWSMSVFGKPKLTIYCGNCQVPWQTREWIPVVNENKSAAICPRCAYWNLMRVVYN